LNVAQQRARRPAMAVIGSVKELSPADYSGGSLYPDAE
jgi:hypothetical protein